MYVGTDKNSITEFYINNICRNNIKMIEKIRRMVR